MELDRMLKALGEPMRLKIYQTLLERKHCVCSLSKKFGVSESSISQHMKVMKEARLVYKQFKKKKLSPITLIMISAAAGIVAYGIS